MVFEGKMDDGDEVEYQYIYQETRPPLADDQLTCNDGADTVSFDFDMVAIVKQRPVFSERLSLVHLLSHYSPVGGDGRSEEA